MDGKSFAITYPKLVKSKQSQNVIRRREAPEHTIQYYTASYIYIYIYI